MSIPYYINVHVIENEIKNDPLEPNEIVNNHDCHTANIVERVAPAIEICKWIIIIIIIAVITAKMRANKVSVDG